jgi:5-methylcytosine-specific restriction endonuclease McrA
MQRSCRKCDPPQLIDMASWEQHQNAHRNSRPDKRPTGWGTPWDKARKLALARYGAVCCTCGATRSVAKACGDRIEVHHVIPHADGGSDHLSNLRVYCSAHHPRGKGSGYGPRADGIH